MMSEQQENINPSASVSTPMDISSSGSSSGSAKVPTWANSLSSSTTAERNSEGTVRGSAQQFATVATGGSKRASVLGDIFRGSQSNRVTEAEKRLSVLSQDDTWEVSLAEKKPAGKRNKVSRCELFYESPRNSYK